MIPQNFNNLIFNDQPEVRISNLSILSGPFAIKELSECRFCKSSDETQDNPLISPCNCTGSIKYIHVKCMKAWYQSKLARNVSEYVNAYSMKGLECELCKYKFDTEICANGQQFSLIDIDKPKNGKPYIVLVSQNEDNLKDIFVITPNPNTLITIVFLILSILNYREECILVMY